MLVNEKIEEKIEEAQVKEKTRKKPSALKIISIVLFTLFIVAATVFFVHEYRSGHFSSVDSFDSYISSYGVAAPIVLIVFQCIKVLYAIIPGAIGCIVGAQMFGCVGGFICSYIGICAGSMLAFMLSRRYGMRIMRFIFSEKRYNKSIKWMEKHNKKYSVFLWIAICFPFAPDDFLCYFSGLTTISFKKFAIIILTAKPWTILGYSLIFGGLF